MAQAITNPFGDTLAPDQNQSQGITNPFGDTLASPTVVDNKNPNPIIETNVRDSTGIPIGPVIHDNPTSVDQNQNNLPDPTTNMYQGLNDQQAQDLYDTYSKAPGASKNAFGQLIYNGKVVIEPYSASFGTPGIGTRGATAGQLIGGAVKNTVRNLGEDVAAGVQYITGNKDIIPTYEDIADAVGLQPTDFGGVRDTIVGEGAQAALGSTIGLGLGNVSKLNQIMEKAPFVIRGLSKIAQANVGAMSSVGEEKGAKDQSGLFIGPKSYLTLWKGLDTTSPDEAKNILSHRMNLIADGVLTSGIVSPVGKGISFVSDFMNNILVKPFQLLKENNREQQFVSDITSYVLDIPTDASKTTRREAINKISDYIKQHKELAMQIANEKIDDVKILRDSLTSMEEGFKNENNTLGASRARELRTGLLKTGSPTLEEKLSQPTKEFTRVQNQAEINAGGLPAMEDTKNNLIESGHNQLATEGANIGIKEAQIEQAERNANIDLSNHPLVQGQTSDLTGPVDFNPNRAKQETSTEIGQAFARGKSLFGEKRKALYDAIPDNTQADDQSVFNTISNMAPSSKEQLPSILKDALGNDSLEEAPISDFKWLYTKVRPDLVNQIGRLNKLAQQGNLNNDSRQLLSDLTSLKNNIDDTQVQYLNNTHQDAAVNAVDNIKNFETQEYAPIFREGNLGKLNKDLYQADRGKAGIKETDWGSAVDNYTQQTIGSGNVHQTNQLVKFLSTEEGGKRPELVTDYIKGDIASTLNSELAAGVDISNLTQGDFTKMLSKYGPYIDKNPELQNSIRSFLDQLSLKKSNIDSLKSDLTSMQKNFDKLQDQIFNKELGPLFDHMGMPTQNAYKSFKDILSRDDSGNQIDTLVQRAKATNSLSGLQAAYSRFMKDHFLSAQGNISGTQKFNLGAFKSIKENGGSFPILEYGKKIYGDSIPGLQEATDALISMAGNTELGRQGAQASLPSGQPQLQQLKSAIGMVTTYVFGILNSNAARIKITTGRYLKHLDPDNIALNILEKLYTDPEYFLKVADEAVQPGGQLGSKYGADVTLTPALKRWTAGVAKAIIHSKMDSNKYPEGQEKLDILNSSKKERVQGSETKPTDLGMLQTNPTPDGLNK